MADSTDSKEAPRFSDFNRPVGKPKEPMKKDEDIPTPPPTDTEKTAEKKAQTFAGIDDVLMPVKDYRKFLKENDITEDEAAKIVDDLLTQGFYEETIALTRRTSIRLRTRLQQDSMRLQTTLQIRRPIYESAVNEIIGRYNIAASLSLYKDKVFDFPAVGENSQSVIDTLFTRRLDFVECLPEPVFVTIQNKLARFDTKIALIFREGVVENF